ncbi:hypothetical protein FXO38_08000, partial [Capsicum annuum]
MKLGSPFSSRQNSGELNSDEKGSTNYILGSSGISRQKLRRNGAGSPFLSRRNNQPPSLPLLSQFLAIPICVCFDVWVCVYELKEEAAW